MHWCYRVVKYEDKGEWVYGMCEVFYDGDKNDILGFGDVFTTFDEYKELKSAYEMMAEAFKHPILEYNDKTKKFTEIKDDKE